MKILAGGLAAAAIAGSLIGAGAAHADPFGVSGMGCETVRWGFL